MKSCVFFQGRDESEGRLSKVAIQSLLWAIYYLNLLRLSRCPCHAKLCAVLKFRAKLKTAQLENSPLMSRHMIVCRGILNLWEDKLSSSCDIKHFMNC